MSAEGKAQAWRDRNERGVVDGSDLYRQAIELINKQRHAIMEILSHFENHPGISDLDDEQIMHMRCTLGDIRKWRNLV